MLLPWNTTKTDVETTKTDVLFNPKIKNQKLRVDLSNRRNSHKNCYWGKMMKILLIRAALTEFLNPKISGKLQNPKSKLEVIRCLKLIFG